MNDGLQRRSRKARAIAIQASAEDARKTFAATIMLMAAATAAITEGAWLVHALLAAH